MAEADLKKSLLQTLAASAEREAELHRLVSDPAPAGRDGWAAKDHVAHLAHWRRYAAQALTAARAGNPEPDASDVDTVNASVFEANRGRSPDDVREDALASYAELGRAVDDCSADDLVRPRAGRETLAWEVVPPNGHIHLGEHLGFWHQAHGDEAAAEQAQKWVLEVHESAFADPRNRAFGQYNLACYYARQGRSVEALPHIVRSFELHPALKKWASKDKDLDPIRDEPEMRSILS